VLDALDEHDLADHTLVVCTTDHGLAFPGAKATLYDRGIGVLLIVRGPGGFHGGRVCDALVSQIDLFPTLCELAGIATPEWTRGRSLLPLLRHEAVEVNDAIFGEITYHAAYEPQRAIRTRRFKYIRRFDNGHAGPVLANIDDSPSKEELLAHGLATRAVAEEELYDLVFDPNEADNLVGEVAYADVVADLRERLATWMAETADPLLKGPVEPQAGTELNLPGQRSATDPTIVARR
jgi:arylsulfatase A-like enzyme